MKKKILLINGLYLLSLHSEYNVNNLPWIKAHDREAIHYAAPFLPKNPIILEAGVCDAEDTIRMKKKWPNSVIYGFEPLPKHYTLSKKNTAHLKNIHLYACALSDKVGTATFYESQKASGTSSLLADNLDHINIPSDINHDGINYQDKPITVSCTTIDFWADMAGIRAIDYIWLDTEGAELFILKNAKKILPTVKVISVEANFKEFRVGMTKFSDLYEFLINEGFVLKYIWGRSDWQGVAIFVNQQLI